MPGFGVDLVRAVDVPDEPVGDAGEAVPDADARHAAGVHAGWGILDDGAVRRPGAEPFGGGRVPVVTQLWDD